VVRDAKLALSSLGRVPASQNGLTAKDLVPMIGKTNRVYEILNRKRGLTLKMIWNLHRGLGIPAESLIKPTTLG
jgi:HTH-type transcriptional regulator/antitoxin HigA